MLDADGEASMFFWNDQFRECRRRQRHRDLDCQISLVSEDEARWEDLVTFVDPHGDEFHHGDLVASLKGVTLSLNLDIQNQPAKATLF